MGGGFWVFWGGDLGLWLWKRREDAGNRSQIVSGGVRDACGALARVSALSGIQKPPKFTEIERLTAKSLTVP